MANPEHLGLLERSVEDWNKWRADNTGIRPDLSQANLSAKDLREVDLHGADLREVKFHEANLQDADLHGGVLYKAILLEADLRGANLRQANLREAALYKANLRGADLNRANLRGAMLGRADLRGTDLREAILRDRAFLQAADLREADLRKADLPQVVLSEANLHAADLREANLSGADLHSANLFKALLGAANLSEANLIEADLREANLCEADLSGANLGEADLSGAHLAGAKLERSMLINTICNKAIFTGCRVHGISAWDLKLVDTAEQNNLVITPTREPDITVDNLEVAQFIYLLLNNQRMRQVIDTITSKVVLILGRFTQERKVVLEAIREKLRTKNYSPVVFDFEKSNQRDLTETVFTLVGMAKFVIADLTDPKSIPHELMSFVEKFPSVPVQPLLLASQQEYAMFEHLQRYPWVMETVLYQDQDALLRSLESTVILPAEQKAKELISRPRK